MRNIDPTPYLRLSLPHNILVPLSQIKAVIESKKYKVFYLLKNREITHTISFGARTQALDSYVSANHCQDRSNMTFYDIKKCEGYNCFISKDVYVKNMI